MRIQHNIMAMNAYRNYNTNTSALSKNLEKLSSGYKINRAGDDAAGLAISEKMRAQITGLEAAQKNVKDGISLVKTAEGAMQEIQDMLNRMDYLATQSANGTYDDDVDRANLQKEVDALRTEIDRIADSANFNGIKLLNGDLKAETETVTTEAVEIAGAKGVLTAATDDIKDGTRPTSATKATITIQGAADADVTAAKTGLSGAITVGTTDAEAIGNMTIGGLSVKDNFDIYIDGTKIDLSDSTSKATTLDANKELKLVAKNGGSLGNTVETTLTNTALTATTFVNGKDEGADGDPVQAEYTFTFDLAKINGNQSFTFNGNTYVFTLDGDKTDSGTTKYINIKDMDSADDTDENGGQAKIANAIVTALKADTKFKLDNEAITGDEDAWDAAVQNGVLTVVATADKTQLAGAAGNIGAPEVSDAADAPGGDKLPGAITATQTKFGAAGEKGNAGSYAEVTYRDFDVTKMDVGDTLTIGGKTVEVVDDDATDLAANQIKKSDVSGAALTQKFKDIGYPNGIQLTINDTDKTIKITDATEKGGTGAALVAGNGKVEYATEKTAQAAGSKEKVIGGGRTLQIGDTSDKFNQMSVVIGDMHVNAMGTGKTTIDGVETNITDTIEDIDISSQTGAQNAINVIKNAINYVSSIRGDLGAVQNRLEHTANNLSVMAENIQDAESTIRDTDVAEEMMAYTKNNILVQSAQAMLAQANAVPQGVLQLLG